MSNLFKFGTGKVIAIPTLNPVGSIITIPQPIVIANLQEVSVDFSFETKKVYGEKTFALAMGRGKSTITWSAKSASFGFGVLGGLALGIEATAAKKATVLDSPITVPADPGPYTVTPVVPDSGTYVADLGVTNAVTGAPLLRVDTSPATGQYSESAGAYTFAAADKGDALLVNFEYSVASSTAASYYNIRNQIMGNAPQFAAIFTNSFAGKTQVMKLNANMIGKLADPLKSDDFSVADLSAEACADSAGNVGYVCQY